MAATLPYLPVLVAHSMGALAAQKYAEGHEVAGLVLLTPVVPAEVGGPVIDVPFDPSAPCLAARRHMTCPPETFSVDPVK